MNLIAKVAAGGCTSVLQLFISKSEIDPNYKDSYGRTAMYWAAASGHDATVGYLLHTLHADPKAADNCGRGPLTVATKSGHRDVVHILQMYGAIVASEKELEAGLVRRFEETSPTICDVCQLWILATETRFHCLICAGGDFDICAECKELGVKCLNGSHQLFKQIMTEGEWIEVE
jgi:ankyrin repeat protein